MSRENIETVRRAYEAFNRGDPETVFALLDDEFVYRARDELPGGGEFEGHQAFRDRLTGLGEVFAEVRFEPQEIIDAGSHVVVVLSMIARGRTSGAELDQPIIHVWRFEEGRGKELRVYAQRDDALRAVGLRD